MHAAAQFAGGERQGRLGGGPGGDAVEGFAQVGADREVVADLAVAEVEGRERRPFLGVGPEPVGVGAVDGQEGLGDLGAAPAGGRPDRHTQAEVFGDAAQGGQVLGPVVELVVDLGGDDRAAVGVGEPFELGDGLAVEGAHQVEVGGVVGAGRQAAFDEPVGEAAVAGLAVRPGAEADDDVEAVSCGGLDEGAQVAVPVPAEAAGLGLVRLPEDVGGDGVEAAGAGVPEGLGPAFARQARVVDLAADGEPGPAVAFDPPVVDVDAVARAGRLAEREAAAGGRGRRRAAQRP